MIQLNLLPDVKLEYIKAQNARRLVMSVAFIAGTLAVVLLVLLLGMEGLQAKHLNDLKHDISNETATLKSKPDINKILTVQNQLESLTQLHASKPAASRLFDYLNELTPANVSINNFNIDFTQDSMSITGSADSLASVNRYVDTLKFTKYSVKGGVSNAKAFNNVVLSSFSLNSNARDSNQLASYTINLSYDKNIFDITQPVDLTVPNQITTRSQVEQPTDLFQAVPTQNNGGGR